MKKNTCIIIYYRFFFHGLYSVNLAGINAEVSQNFESVLNLPFLPEGQGRYILMAVENVPVLIGRFSMESKTSDQMAFINQARQAIQPNRPGHAHKAIQNRKSPQILTLEFIPLSAYSPGIDRAVFEDLGNYYHEIKLRRLARPEGLQLHIERMQESAYRLALSRVPDLTALDAVKLEGQVLPFEQTLENQARKLGYSVNQDTKFVLQLGDTLDRSRYYITFNAGFQKGGDNILLLPVKTMPADLEPMMRMGRLSKKVIGFNITSPHKVSAIRYLNELDETARIPGAVEAILKQEDGSLKGYNYAGDGWAYWYTQFVGESLKAKKIVILGAGGAARTLVHSIFQAAIDAHITVYDRQERITDELIANQKAHNPPCDLRAVSKANLNDDISQADIVINLTGSGKGYDDQNPIAPDIDYKLLRGKVVVDANYRFQGERKLNEFLRRASEAKAKKVLNGLGFSVGSIAPDIQLFSGKKVNFEDLMKVATTSLADGGAGLQNTTENGSEAMLTPAQALEANLTPGLSQLLEEGGWIETRGKLLKRDKELVDKLAQGLEPSLIELLKTYERPAEPGHKAVVYNPEEISSIAKRLADNGVRIALRAKRGDDVKQLRVLLGGQYESARGLLEFLWAEKRGEELKVPIEGLRVLLSSLIESFPSEVREDPSKIKQLLTDDNGLIQRLVLFREVYGYLKEYAGIKNGALEFLKGDLFTSAYYIGRGSKISENAVKNIIELKETIGLVSAQSKLVKQQWLIAVYTMASRNKSALGAIQEYANAGVKWQESWSEALKVQYLIAVYNVASRDKSVAGVISGYENTGIKWHDDWSDELKVQYLIAVYKVAMEGQSAVDVIKGYEDAGIKWQDTWSDEIKVQFLTAVYSIAMYGKTAATVIQEYESAGIKWHEDWDDALKEQFLISVYVVAMKGQSVRGVIQEYENAGIKWHDDWDVLLKVRYLTAVYCVGVAGKSAVGVIQQYEDAGIKWKDTWSDELKTQYLTAVYVVAMKGKEESLKVILPLLSSRDSLENIERLRLSWRMVLLNYDSQEINTLMDLPSSIGDKVKALNTRVFKKHRERETLIIPIDDGDGSDAMMASKPFERGGIDFNASKINMTRQGSGIEIRFDPAMVAQFRQGNFDGIDPVITGITSIASIYSLLGLR